MGSVQPFLEGSFRSDRARGFGSIQSEAVTRVGRIRSFGEVRNSLDDRRSGNNFPVRRNRALSREDFPGTREYSAPRRARYSSLASVSGSFRIRDELRNSGAFAKRCCCECRRSRCYSTAKKRGSSLRERIG